MRKPKRRQMPVRVRHTLHGDGEATSVRTEARRPEREHPTPRWAPWLRRILPSAADRVAIAEVMQRDVTCVTRDVSVEALTGLFIERGISAVPVVDDDGFPIGIVSKTDLVRERWEDGDTVVASAPPPPGVLGGMHEADVARALVADVMMPLTYTLCEDDPLSRAAAVMDVERVHHLPVVAADGRVVGILSSLDFVHWVAAQSGYADQA